MGEGFAVGNKVQGFFNGKKWVNAIVIEVKPDGSYVVAWEDGATVDCVKQASEIRGRPPGGEPLAYSQGDKVQGLYNGKSGKIWGDAVIAEAQQDGTYLL